MLMTVRLAREEQLLIERFGDKYREYRRKTGGFVPRPRV
jgi:protein-S-isoprenylcysteine O-methyltransferase Ste14